MDPLIILRFGSCIQSCRDEEVYQMKFIPANDFRCFQKSLPLPLHGVQAFDSVQESWTSMKLSKKQIAKESKAPAKVKAGVVQTHVSKSTTKTEKTKKILKVEPVEEQKFHPTAKIKLQLFPLDDVTRMELQKDGYHPYLELTLSSRKKISSVVKHVNYKWGNSRIAGAEPALFPYISSENLPNQMWTKKDDDVTAGDVLVSIGSPSVFRLRYGWLSDCEQKSSGVPSTSTGFKSSSQPEEIGNGCSNDLGSARGKQKQTKETSGDLKPTVLSGSGAEVVTGANKVPSDRSIEPTQNEVKIHAGIGQTSSLWDDSLTNISIGGLLSEASLQGRFSNHDNPKSEGTSAGLQPPQLISDSFDAFLMAQANFSQAPRLPPPGSTSSILDAEDTCHAFAFQKNTSSSKDAAAFGGTNSNNCSQDSVFKSFKHPNSESISQGRGCKESETDLSLCSRVCQDESSLGLSGIKWSDSLGPFDLGLSSRKIINGDSLSISRVFS